MKILNTEMKIKELTKNMKAVHIRNSKITEYELNFATGDDSFDVFSVNVDKMLASFTSWNEVGGIDESTSYNLEFMIDYYSFKNRLEERIEKDKSNMY